MKNLALNLSILAMLLSTSCNEQVVVPSDKEVSYEEQIRSLNSMYSEAFSNAASFLDRHKERGRLNLSGAVISSFEQMKGTYVPKDFSVRSAFFRPFNAAEGRSKSDVDSTVYFSSFLVAPDTFDISSSVIFTEDQQILLEPFLDLIFQAEISAIDSIIQSFNVNVISSTLSEERKFQLLAFAAGLKGSKDFAENGGVEMINDLIAYSIDPASSNGRAARCRVDTRSVMIGAAWGALSGAAAGGFIGATAGSFTVPVLGTAVGGVGGAVYGAASGFVGGVFGSIATELISTCFRQQASLCASLDHQLRLAQQRGNNREALDISIRMTNAGCQRGTSGSLLIF